MKSFAIISASLALAACSGAPSDPANNIQDVAANDMAPDEVTEVADDSASVEPGGSEELNGTNASNAH